MMMEIVDDIEASDTEVDEETLETLPSLDEVPENLLPPNIVVPERSKKRYVMTYEKFLAWKSENNYEYPSEDVLTEYFEILSDGRKPSSLWSIFSMLKYTIYQNHGLNIGTYKKLTGILKKKSIGFKSKKAKILESDEVERFINEAPDIKYLATKVALIFGIKGACKRNELCSITVDDIEDHNSLIIVNLPKEKTSSPRSFTVVGKYYEIYEKYAALRPQATDSNRFFLNYQKGKCTNQVIGINKFGLMPKEIASFLGLANPEEYNTHSFRNTSTSFFVDFGSQLAAKRKREMDIKPEENDAKVFITEAKLENIEENNSNSNCDPISTESFNLNSIVDTSVSNLFAHLDSYNQRSEREANDKSKTSGKTKETELKDILTKMLNKMDKKISFNFNNCPDINIHIHKHNK